jgi:hypothetical protein
MARPTPKRVPLQSPIKQLRVEHVDKVNISKKWSVGVSVWHIWLTANGNFTLGTFLRLCDDGTIQRVTWHEDGTETVFEVTDDEQSI